MSHQRVGFPVGVGGHRIGDQCVQFGPQPDRDAPGGPGDRDGLGPGQPPVGQPGRGAGGELARRVSGVCVVAGCVQVTPCPVSRVDGALVVVGVRAGPIRGGWLGGRATYQPVDSAPPPAGRPVSSG